MFEQPDSKRIGGALGAGFLTELFIVGLVLLISYLIPEKVYKAVLPPQLSDKIVWLSDPGPGGGGGGGNKMPDPPKPAEIVKPKPAPTPVPSPPNLQARGCPAGRRRCWSGRRAWPHRAT